MCVLSTATVQDDAIHMFDIVTRNENSSPQMSQQCASARLMGPVASSVCIVSTHQAQNGMLFIILSC